MERIEGSARPSLFSPVVSTGTIDAGMRIHTRFSTTAGESTSERILDRGERHGLSEFRKTR